MSKPTFSVNEAEFKRVLQRYAEDSLKTIRDTYNARMLDVLIKAYVRTPSLRTDKFSSRMVEMVPFSKAGRTGGAMTRRSLMALRNMIARGKKAVGGKELLEAGLRLHLAKLRAAKFMKSGWVPALRIFNVVRTRLRNRPPRPNLGQERSVRGRDKGSGKAAVEILRPEAVAENTVRDIGEVGARALDSAFRSATARMESILRGELEEVKKRRWDGRVVR